MEQLLSIKVMFGSPSDVTEEYFIFKKVLSDWNNKVGKVRKIHLSPLNWREDSYADCKDEDAQMNLNRQLIDQSDFLIAVFGGRLGTPTNNYVSGTVEEIERHLQQKKHVSIFFRQENKVTAKSIAQMRKVLKYKETVKGYYVEYSNPADFEQVLRSNLENLMNGLFKDVGAKSINKSIKMDEVFNAAETIVDHLNNDSDLTKQFQPQLIVAIGRGGAIFGSLISYKLNQVKVMAVDREHSWNKGKRISKPFFDFTLPSSAEYNNILLVTGEDHSGDTLKNFKDYILTLNPNANIRTCSLFLQNGNTSYPDYIAIKGDDYPLMPWQDESYIRDSHSPEESAALKEVRKRPRRH